MIMDTANDKLHEWAMTQELRVHRSAGRIAAKIDSVMRNEVYPDIAAQIDGIPWQQMTNNQMRLHQLRSVISNGMPIDSMTRTFENGLIQMGLGDAQNFVSTLEKVLPVSINLSTPSPEQMVSLVTEQPFNGQVMSEWFGKFGQTTQNEIEKAFRLGMIEGKTIPEMGKEIGKVTGVFSGMSKKIKRNTEAVARTATTLVNSRARELSYAENSDIIKGVEYLATLDDRTTAVCISLDGKVFPVGEGARPPQHWNCRSTTVPVVKSWEEMGIPAKDATASTRASLNGQVSADTTAEKWLKGRKASVQNQILGVKRGDLFRSGIPVNDMLSPDGKLMTLKTLRGKGFDVGKIAGDAKVAEPEPIRFVAAKTKAEAEKWATDNLIEQEEVKRYDRWVQSNLDKGYTLDQLQKKKFVSYRGVSLEVANYTNEHLAKYKNMNLTALKEIKSTHNKGSWAARMSNHGRLEINTKYAKTLDGFEALSTKEKTMLKQIQSNMNTLEANKGIMDSRQQGLLEKAQEITKYKRLSTFNNVGDLLNHEMGHHVDFKGWQTASNAGVDKDAWQSMLTDAKVALVQNKYNISSLPELYMPWQQADEFFAEAWALYMRGDIADLPIEALNLFKVIKP